jgi:predicted DNA-binding protein (MmcQ/YjbR family)
MPFGEQALVFKVGGKIFLLIGLEKANRFNVKCDPERAIELREQHHEIIPGFHMNKKHWNTVVANRELDDRKLEELILHSYQLIVESLPSKLKREIKGL